MSVVERTGLDLREALDAVLKKVKYDDAPLCVYVDGTYRLVRYVTYDQTQNLIVIQVGAEGIKYDGIREGWRP